MSTQSRQRRYSMAGALLGLGAPAGFLVLRALVLGRIPGPRFVRRELSRSPLVYGYMGIATSFVFALFGAVLGRREERLRQKQSELDRTRSELGAMIAHDLRNPVSTILLQVESLMRRGAGPAREVPEAALERIRSSVLRLDQMIDDLLDVSRIELGRLKLSPRAIRLPVAIRSVLKRLAPVLGAHELSLEVHGDPPRVALDPLRFDQIVTNLVENAAKYSPPTTPIRVEVAAVDEPQPGVRLSVHDLGIGIRPEELGQLFDRFYQGTRVRAQKTGLGLGLHITRGLVEAHGGRIWAESKPGRGSSFHVFFPAAPAAGAEMTPK